MGNSMAGRTMIKINRALLILISTFVSCHPLLAGCVCRLPGTARTALYPEVPGAGPLLPAPSGSYCLCFIRSLVNPALPLLALILVSLGPELI